MKRILLLLICYLITTSAFCQNDSYTLQYGKNNHVFRVWKQGQNIKVKTIDDKTISGKLLIRDRQFIQIQDTLIDIKDIHHVCTSRWTEAGLVTAGIAASVIIDPFFGLCAATIIAIRLMSPYNQVESKQFKIIQSASGSQKKIDPARYAFDSASFTQNNYRLYRYPIMPFESVCRYPSNHHIKVFTSEKKVYQGRLRMVDSAHIAVASDTIAINTITRFNNHIMDPERDTLVPSLLKWKKIYPDVKKKYWNYRNQYLLSHPPGDYLYLGTDLLKYTVPKPNITFDYYTKYHVGFSAAAGWKPLNPHGNGFGFTWNSNVDFCSESKQLKIGPFFWSSTQNLHTGLRIGPYYYYKHLYADNIYIADIHDGYIEYDLYWHDKREQGLGVQMGIFHQRSTGLDVQFSIGYNHITLNDSVVDHSDVRIVNDKSWSVYYDFSVIYSFRINKKHTGKNED